MPYTVQVNNPPALYPRGYFPRKYRYLKEAKEVAQRAVDHGASMACVFPEVEDQEKEGKVILFFSGKRNTTPTD